MNWIKDHERLIICILIVFLFFILLIPIYFYFKQFGNNGFSDNSSDWGNFGDYLNGTIISIVTIINTIILVVLMKIANNIQKQSAIIQEKSARLDRKHIIFKPYTDKINTLFLEIQFKYSAKDKADIQQSIKLLSILHNQFDEFVKEIESVFKEDKEGYEFIKKQNNLIKSKIQKLKQEPENKNLLVDIFNEKYKLFDKINENYNL